MHPGGDSEDRPVQRVADFARAYAEAFAALDVRAIADFYDLPLPVIRPDRTAIVTDRETLRAELAKIRDTYAWSGLARVAPVDVEEVGIGDGLGVLNVSWHLFDREDRPITTIDSTYLLRSREGELRIAGIVAHNEEARRAPLIRTAAPENRRVD